MLNVAWFSGVSRFVMVTSTPGDVKIKPPLGSSIVFAFPFTSSCSGKSQVPGKNSGGTIPLTSSGAPPFGGPSCANTVGAAIVSAKMTLRANTIARFTTVFLLFISWLCLHSHLGETGHLPCGFDTRFLSLRRFPQAQVVGWVAGSHLEGGQVAVLRLHVASARLRSERRILLLLLVRGGGSSSRPSATPPRTNVAHPCSPPTPFRGRVVC